MFESLTYFVLSPATTFISSFTANVTNKTVDTYNTLSSTLNNGALRNALLPMLTPTTVESIVSSFTVIVSTVDFTLPKLVYTKLESNSASDVVIFLFLNLL